jgi:hypothetical protein
MANPLCNCAGPLDEEYEYLNTLSSDDTEAASDDSEVFNTSYRKATPLFREIERENWQGVLLFLTTGKWSNSIFANTTAHMKSPSAALQAKTWVTSYDEYHVPEWSQLPLHAAISYSAPFVVIKKLVELYPKSLQCTDNEGMLPIHLAFGFGASEVVLAFLLAPFPTSMNEPGLGGRYPYQCCELGPNKARAQVYKIVADQITTRVKREQEKELREFCNTAQKKLGLDLNVQGGTTALIYELLKSRKELEELKMANKKKRGVVTHSGNSTTFQITEVAPLPKQQQHQEKGKKKGRRKFFSL